MKNVYISDTTSTHVGKQAEESLNKFKKERVHWVI